MAKKIIKQLRDFPSVEEILQTEEVQKLIGHIPRPIAVDVVRKVISDLKTKYQKDSKDIPLSLLYTTLAREIRMEKRKEVTKVINATGIVVHTNLGRAPLSDSLFDSIKKTAVGYGNIEYDLDKGVRGNRGIACENYLANLSGAESGTVVNNCAAALFIILNTLSNRKKVIISRSELVQIGGGFRIPDILKKTGARLCEVGSTNITNLDDYEKQIDDKTGIILKVHQSNFVQKGFIEQVDLKTLVTMGKKHNIPVINDLGSGVFVSTETILGYNEPTVQQSVRDGAAVTCFSGDKLLGGGQAGLIVGKSEYITQIKKNPLFRIMRVDKIVFSMLENLLRYYLENQWQTQIKLWSILSVSDSDLYKRGRAILAELGKPDGLSVEATHAFVGGGALPEAKIPSVGIVFSHIYKANVLMIKFRELDTPVVGRIENDSYILDLKAVDEKDLDYITKVIRKIIREKL